MANKRQREAKKRFLNQTSTPSSQRELASPSTSSGPSAASGALNGRGAGMQESKRRKQVGAVESEEAQAREDQNDLDGSNGAWGRGERGSAECAEEGSEEGTEAGEGIGSEEGVDAEAEGGEGEEGGSGEGAGGALSSEDKRRARARVKLERLKRKQQLRRKEAEKKQALEKKRAAKALAQAQAHVQAEKGEQAAGGRDATHSSAEAGIGTTTGLESNPAEDRGPQGNDGAVSGLEGSEGGASHSAGSDGAQERAPNGAGPRAQGKGAREGRQKKVAGGRGLKGTAAATNGVGGKEKKVHPLRMAGYRPGEACFICKEKGHGAKFCPVKQQRLLQAQARKVSTRHTHPDVVRLYGHPTTVHPSTTLVHYRMMWHNLPCSLWTPHPCSCCVLCWRCPPDLSDVPTEGPHAAHVPSGPTLDCRGERGSGGPGAHRGRPAPRAWLHCCTGWRPRCTEAQEG